MAETSRSGTEILLSTFSSLVDSLLLKDKFNESFVDPGQMAV